MKRMHIICLTALFAVAAFTNGALAESLTADDFMDIDFTEVIKAMDEEARGKPKEPESTSTSATKDRPTATPKLEFGAPDAVITQKEKFQVNWTQNYVEGTGMAVAPRNMRGAQAKSLAKRGAMVDFQRNLLEFLKGVQIDARTVMEDFMASDTVRSEIHGIIKNAEALEGTWDGETYTVKGRIPMSQLRVVLAPKTGKGVQGGHVYR